MDHPVEVVLGFQMLTQNLADIHKNNEIKVDPIIQSRNCSWRILLDLDQGDVVGQAEKGHNGVLRDVEREPEVVAEVVVVKARPGTIIPLSIPLIKVLGS